MKNLCKSFLALMLVLTFNQCTPPGNSSSNPPTDTIAQVKPPVILPPVIVDPAPDQKPEPPIVLPPVVVPDPPKAEPMPDPEVQQPDKPVEVKPEPSKPVEVKPDPVIEVKPQPTPVETPKPNPVVVPTPKPDPKPEPLPPAARTLRDSPITWGVAFKESDLTRQKVIDETYKHFRSVTAENGMKAGKVQKKEGVFDFTQGKALVKIAKAKGLRVHAHACFVWPSQEKNLPAFWHEAAKDKNKYIALLKNTVQTYVRTFKGDISGIDIINEAHENDGKLRPCYALTHMGETYPEQIAKWVKEVDKEVNIFISDFDYENLSHKTTVVIKYAGDLKKKGLVDGLSSQMHTGIKMDYKNYKKRLDEMAKQNLLVHISELDLRVKFDIPEADRAEKFREIATGFRTLPTGLQYGITVWSHIHEGNFLNYKLSPAQYAPVIFNKNYEGGLVLDAILSVK
jgi:endo-1,4-beta-xylanase